MMDRMDSKSFLGKGLNFPFRVQEGTGKIAMVSHEDDIRQSVELILRTYRGERVMRPDFGTRVEDYLFAENTKETGFALQREIEQALTQWEPRIDDIAVEAIADEKNAALQINITYRVRSTNNLFNVVYPFYTLEGTGMEGFDA